MGLWKVIATKNRTYREGEEIVCEKEIAQARSKNS